MARKIVEELLLLGHTKIGDLLAVFESKAKAKRETVKSGSNGDIFSNGTSKGHTEEDDNPDQEELNDALIQLLETRFIEPVVGSMFHSASDTYNDTENEIKHQEFGGSIKGPKKLEELKARTCEKLRELRAERAWQGTKSLKRQSNGSYVNGAKRRKLANGDMKINGDVHDHDAQSLKLDVGCLNIENVPN